MCQRADPVQGARARARNLIHKARSTISGTLCRDPAFDRDWLNKNPLVLVLGFVGCALVFSTIWMCTHWWSMWLLEPLLDDMHTRVPTCDSSRCIAQNVGAEAVPSHGLPACAKDNCALIVAQA
jgi:hypothetical protein